MRLELQLGTNEASAEPSIPSPSEHRHVSVIDERGSYDDDLGWIIRQLKERIQASTVIVTVHYAGGKHPDILVRDGVAGPSIDDIGSAFWSKARFTEKAQEWHQASSAFPWHTLTLNIAGNHCSRAVISAFYCPTSAVECGAVDYVVSRLQPILAGYFKLWLLHRSTSRRMQTIISALDPVDFGVVAVNQDGNIVFENPAATAILDRGSALYRSRGSVCAIDSLSSVRLRVAIEHSLSTKRGNASGEDSSQIVFIKSTLKSAPLIAVVNVVKQSSSGEDDPVSVIHLFQPPTAIEQMIGPACEWYKLSPVETRLVTRLVAGSDVAEIAAQELIKQNTVRTYLKNVFRKTGTKSQADVVRAMLAVSVRLIRPQPDADRQ